MTAEATSLAVLEGIDPGEIARDLAELVAIPSVDGTAAEAEAQRWCADRLRRIGLAVDQWETGIEALRVDSEFPGMEVERESVVGCVGVLGADAATPGSYAVPGLVLYGHTDVVPPGDPTAWESRDPFRLEVVGDVASGRGACDMKAGVAAVLATVRALCRARVRLSRPLAVHLVSAEEDGGAGAVATLARGHDGDGVVIAEPTGGALVPANAGALTFRIEVVGLSTHGSTRDRGVSAVEAFEVVHAALRGLEAERNAARPSGQPAVDLFDHLDLPWPISVGVLRAGEWASTVPDRLVAEGRYGVAVGESVEAARDAFEAAVAQACRSDPWLRGHPVQVTWPGGQFASAALPEGAPLLRRLAGAVSRVTGTSPPVLGAPYGSDLRHYLAHGIPAVQHGPGDVRVAHAVDEHVSLSDTVACAKVYALLALECCASPSLLQVTDA